MKRLVTFLAIFLLPACDHSGVSLKNPGALGGLSAQSQSMDPVRAQIWKVVETNDPDFASPPVGQYFTFTFHNDLSGEIQQKSSTDPTVEVTVASFSYAQDSLNHVLMTKYAGGSGPNAGASIGYYYDLGDGLMLREMGTSVYYRCQP